MRNLGMIAYLEPITAEQFKKLLGKHTRFSFTFTATFEEMIEMGYASRQHITAWECVNEENDELLNSYVTDLRGSMSDMNYNIIGFEKQRGLNQGVAIIRVTSSVKDLELPDSD